MKQPEHNNILLPQFPSFRLVCLLPRIYATVSSLDIHVQLMHTAINLVFTKVSP